MDAEIYRWVCNIVDLITSTGATLYIYRGRFRWKFPIAAAFIIVPLVIDIIGAGYIHLSDWHALLYFLLNALIGFILFKPGLIMRSGILITIYEFAFSIGGMILYLLVIIPYRWLTGSPSTTWFAGPGMTLDEMVIYNVLKIVTAVLFSLLTVKLAGKIDAMKNDIIIPMFMIFFLPSFLNGIIDCFTYTETSPLSGLSMAVDALSIVITLLCLIGLALAIMRRTYVENRLLAMSIAEDAAYYQRIRNIQQELRELRHDLHNYLQADSEKALIHIPAYIASIKGQLKELHGDE